jgi:hypothetical protein
MDSTATATTDSMQKASAQEMSAREATAHEATAHEATAHEATAHEATAHEATALPVPVRAYGRVMKRLGHWTQQRHFDVRASGGSILLDLRSPLIAAGNIEVHLDIDRAVVKLLVPDGAVMEDGDARRVGRCRVKDWTGTAAPGGRRIVLSGELRNAEVRVHRGGIAMLSAMCSREYLADALQARREGRYPTIDDPSR